ncbi:MULTISPECIES: hypothetical protein [Streptosporangium]|uniref:Uncharacterized protein n=1 Tax=Streptosporangium brasiliense TaxID=47480 RepID=A0ABT9RAR8_9ACTN|nr:hypothetical protein [Streptosporangium brasiliense]MDP9866356.1 hypothetical protein [Streptosporangium brasiliense]
MTLAELRKLYERTWQISESIGSGWYAVRRNAISAQGREHGLSDVRCGATLVELARNLEAETRLESQAWRHVPVRHAPS